MKEKIIEKAQEMFQEHKENHDVADLRICVGEVVEEALNSYKEEIIKTIKERE